MERISSVQRAQKVVPILEYLGGFHLLEKRASDKPRANLSQRRRVWCQQAAPRDNWANQTEFSTTDEEGRGRTMPTATFLAIIERSAVLLENRCLSQSPSAGR